MKSILTYITERKLTTKTREKLPDSAFCGPNRTFPCHDLKHIASAKAFLDRSNFSDEEKQKIRECIERKEKELRK